MTADLARQIKKLSVAERIILVEEIWDSIAEENEAFKLSKAQKEALERRSKSFAGGRSWDEIKAEFLKA
jgi:putative addiction module component (TIGR02574 family)